MSQTQINQMFNQKDMPEDLKQRFAKRLLQFPHVHNKDYLKQVAKDPNHVSGNYISAVKENQLIKIEAKFPIWISNMILIRFRIIFTDFFCFISHLTP
jgi:poly-D-alanine transfer protein DltD